ncbi:MAG: hypothetical protein H7175_06450 [Burkholderiales bacterium]|nr:hypothetical protein [Anaerolineae bacterium]
MPLIQRSVILAILSLMLIVNGVLPALAQTVTMPAPTGDYPVGRTIYEWTDSTRPELYSDDPDAKRELSIWVWYPAHPGANAQPDAYLPGMLGEIIGQQFGITMSQIQSHVYADAPLADSDSTYPVLVFSHGNGVLVGAYAALLEEIASHGYIVVGINHTYNPQVSVFSDGRIIPASMRAVSNESVEYWVEDTAFVIDQLAMLNAGDERFAGKLDFTRLGIFGHSFGGAAGAEFCHVDSRCTAGIVVDATLRGDSATQGVTQPYMQMFSTYPTCDELMAVSAVPNIEACEAAFSERRVEWQTLFDSAPSGYMVTIDGARHNNFADNGFLLPLVPSLEEGATIDPERAWRIASDYILAFFDKHLNGAESPLLDAPSSDYPDVTFVSHE